MPHGMLTVVVESATDIKDPILHGRGGSYCTLQCGNQVLSTHVADGGSSDPVFRTEFEFEIDRSTNELVISVYSEGTVKDDELIGYTALDFKSTFYHGHTVPLTPYPLSRSSGKARGYINISLKFKSRLSPYTAPYAQDAHHAHAYERQHSAPPYAAPQYPQANRNQHNPHRQLYPIGTVAYEDGYGSSGSDSSRSSRGSSRKSGGSGRTRRSLSQPEQYYEDYNKYEEAAPASYENNAHHPASPRHHASPQPQYNHPAPSPLAPAGPKPGPRRRAVPGGPQVAISSQPHQAIPGGPQLNYANQQQPPRVAIYQDSHVQVYQERLPQQPRVVQQQPPLVQQQPALMQYQLVQQPAPVQYQLVPLQNGQMVLQPAQVQYVRQQPVQVQEQKQQRSQRQQPSVGAQVAGAVGSVAKGVGMGVLKAGVSAATLGLLGGIFE